MLLNAYIIQLELSKVYLKGTYLHVLYNHVYSLITNYVLVIWALAMYTIKIFINMNFTIGKYHKLGTINQMLQYYTLLLRST